MDSINIPGAVVAQIVTTKKFSYNKGNMNFSVDVNVDSVEQVTDMLEIMRICTQDLKTELVKLTTDETRSESTDSVQPVSEGAEA